MRNFQNTFKTRKGSLISSFIISMTVPFSDKDSIKNQCPVSNDFFPFLDLNKIAGVENLKGLSVAVCGMKCIDLTNKIVRSLGIHFSYDNNIQNIQNYMKHATRN